MQLNQIRTDGGTQPRAQLDFMVIGEYAEQMIEGVVFPPVVTFFDGTHYWLADGFHRVNAAGRAGLEAISADVRQGTLQDAQWYSYSVNQSHGLRRSNEDKRRAVAAALKHPYAASKTLHDLARHLGVSHQTIANYKNTIFQNLKDTPRLVTRNGQTYEMNVANIGAAPAVDTRDRVMTPSFQFPDEAQEIDLRFDPTQSMAYCKYCYTTHNDWELSGDHSPAAWVCNRCNHATRDDFMQIEEEEEPEAIDYSAAADTTLDSNEWYTPAAFIDAARLVMTTIDVDPASNETAQEHIQAGVYYTKKTNGLEQAWQGNVWLNPPYGDPLPWIEKLLAEVQAGHATQAVLLVNTANSPQWSRHLWHSSFIVCMLDRRVRFWRPDRTEAKGTAQDQMIWYIGENADAFRRVFGVFGALR